MSNITHNTLAIFLILIGLALAAIAITFVSVFFVKYYKYKKNNNLLNNPHLNPSLSGGSSLLGNSLPCLALSPGDAGYKEYEREFILPYNELDNRLTFDVGEHVTDNLSKVKSNLTLSSHTDIKHMSDAIENFARSVKTNNDLKDPNKNYSVDINFNPNSNHTKRISVAYSDPIEEIRSQYLTLCPNKNLKTEFEFLPLPIQSLLLGILKLTDNMLNHINNTAYLDDNAKKEQTLREAVKVIIRYFRKNKNWEYTERSSSDPAIKYNACRADWEALLNRYFPDHYLFSHYAASIKKPDSLSPESEKMINELSPDNQHKLHTVGDALNKLKIGKLTPTEDQGRCDFIKTVLADMKEFYNTNDRTVTHDMQLSGFFIEGANHEEFKKALRNANSAVPENDCDNLNEWLFGDTRTKEN